MIRQIKIGNSHDAEYFRIIRELKALGIVPSGNKNIDKNKLKQAKQALIDKIVDKQESKFENNIQKIQPPEIVEEPKVTEMEEKRLGAMKVAELNRLYFKI